MKGFGLAIALVVLAAGSQSAGQELTPREAALRAQRAELDRAQAEDEARRQKAIEAESRAHVAHSIARTDMDLSGAAVMCTYAHLEDSRYVGFFQPLGGGPGRDVYRDGNRPDGEGFNYSIDKCRKIPRWAEASRVFVARAVTPFDSAESARLLAKLAIVERDALAAFAQDEKCRATPACIVIRATRRVCASEVALVRAQKIFDNTIPPTGVSKWDQSPQDEALMLAKSERAEALQDYATVAKKKWAGGTCPPASPPPPAVAPVAPVPVQP